MQTLQEHSGGRRGRCQVGEQQVQRPRGRHVLSVPEEQRSPGWGGQSRVSRGPCEKALADPARPHRPRCSFYSRRSEWVWEILGRTTTQLTC